MPPMAMSHVQYPIAANMLAGCAGRTQEPRRRGAVFLPVYMHMGVQGGKWAALARCEVGGGDRASARPWWAVQAWKRACFPIAIS